MAQVAGKALAMPPRKPATFEGMSMEQFKTGRTIDRPTTSANPTARRSPGGGFVMPPSVTASVTPPVTRNAPVTPPVTPRAVTPMSPTENQQFTALGQAMQLSQATQGPMPRPYASTPAPPTASTAPPGGFTPTVSTPPPASPAVAAPAPRAVSPPVAKPKTLAELKAAAEAAKAARQPGLAKVGNAISDGVTQHIKDRIKLAQTINTGVPQLAGSVNTGVPQLAGSVTGSIESAGKTALSSIDNTLAPARNWLAGSEQKSPEELAYEEALAAEQKKKKAPGVPAVTPRPGSSAPQPFSAAALGTAEPRADMPASLTMLGR
jgi:hypothetical protein